MEPPPPVQGNTNRRSVSTLRPSAKDAYMLFQVCPPRGGSLPHTVSPLALEQVGFQTWLMISPFVDLRQEIKIVPTTGNQCNYQPLKLWFGDYIQVRNCSHLCNKKHFLRSDSKVPSHSSATVHFCEFMLILPPELCDCTISTTVMCFRT